MTELSDGRDVRVDSHGSSFWGKQFGDDGDVVPLAMIASQGQYGGKHPEIAVWQTLSGKRFQAFKAGVIVRVDPYRQRVIEAFYVGPEAIRHAEVVVGHRPERAVTNLRVAGEHEPPPAAARAVDEIVNAEPVSWVVLVDKHLYPDIAPGLSSGALGTDELLYEMFPEAWGMARDWGLLEGTLEAEDLDLPVPSATEASEGWMVAPDTGGMFFA